MGEPRAAYLVPTTPTPTPDPAATAALEQRANRATKASAKDEHPAAVYLARLSPGSRRTMRQALNVIAGLLTSGRETAQSLDWPSIRYQHAVVVRTALAERYRPATANKMLAELRGVLRECWRLGLVAAEDECRAAHLPRVKGSTLPAGRALSGRVHRPGPGLR